MAAVKLLIGILMLAAGEQLFWFFICALGFWVGYEAGAYFIFGLPAWQAVAAGLMCGLVGLVLVLFFQGLALLCAGFLAGIYIFTGLWNYFVPAGTSDLWWMLVVISGILGSVFLAIFFNPALVIISSFIGAMFIVQSIHAGAYLKLLLLALLFIIGILIQYKR